MRYLEAVAKLLEEHPLRRKLWICRSFAEGHQLLERISRRLGAVLNTEVWTLEALAANQAGFALARQGKRPVSDRDTFWLVQGIMERLAEQPEAAAAESRPGSTARRLPDTGEDPPGRSAYIPRELVTPGIVAQVHQALLELRNAGVSWTELNEADFVTPEKGRYIKALLAAYEAALERRGEVDFAGLLPWIAPLPGDALVIAPEVPELDGAARRMLDKLADGRLLRVPGDAAWSGPATDAGGDRPAAGGSPHAALQMELFHAAGSMAEVREAFRRLLAAGVPWDQVECIASDYELYAGTLRTLTAELEIPCTFSRGLPAESTQLGRACLHLLEWVENGYPLRLLTGMLREGLLSFRGEREEISAGEWIRALERSGIGWGRERYLAWRGWSGERMREPGEMDLASRYAADEAESDAEEALPSRRPAPEELSAGIADAEENRAGRPEEERRSADRRERSERVSNALQSIFRELFRGLPEEAGDETSPQALFAWLVRTLERCGVRRGEADAAVLQALKEEAGRLQGVPPPPLPLSLALPYVRHALRGLRGHVRAMPEPGALHVSSLADGGVSGRGVTLIVGMDERSWSGAVRPDPVLLDEERARIRPDGALPASPERALRLRRERDARLALLRGRLVLSCSAYDPVEGKAQSPAFELLQAYRRTAGRPAADFAQLREALGAPIGYLRSAGQSAAAALDAADLWRGALAEAAGRGSAGQAALEAAYPGLAAGRAALAARAGAALSPYDGVIDGGLAAPADPAPAANGADAAAALSGAAAEPSASAACADPGRGPAGQAAPEAVCPGFATGRATATGHAATPGSAAGPVVSASRLELYAECPLRYFFQYELGLRAKETVEFDRTRWLQASDRGSLLHRVFALYLAEAAGGPEAFSAAGGSEAGSAAGGNVAGDAAAAGWPASTGTPAPSPAHTSARTDTPSAGAPPRHDRKRLGAIADRVIAEYAERIPAPSRHVFEKECRELRADLEVFYRMELGRTTIPRYFEQELTLGGEPLEVELSDRLSVKLAGFVDRMDEISPHRYRIIDYKTGSPAKYRPNETFAGGTQLQHALYAAAAEQWLRRTGLDPQAEVREAAYVFPTQRGRGQEAVRERQDRRAVAAVVGGLLEAMERGIFVPAKDPRSCQWCDYRTVCGGHAEQMAGKRAAPENEERLRPLLEVERHD